MLHNANMDMNRFYIYKITLLKGSLAGKYYFGKHKMRKDSKNPLTDGYYGSGKILKDYYKVYPFEQGVTAIKEIIEYNDSEEVNCIREQFYIGDKWKTDQNCINLKEGGIGGQYSEESRMKISKALKGYIHSEESRKHMSIAHKGKSPSNKGVPQSEEARRKNSESHKGLKHTQEWKDNMSALMKGRKHGPMSEEQKEKLSVSLKGKKRTEEARKKQGDTLRGRKLTPEWCKHIGDGRRGIKHTEESIEKMRKAKKSKSKSVIMIEPNGIQTVYISQIGASRETGIPRMQIWRCLNGKKETDSKGNKWVAA